MSDWREEKAAQNEREALVLFEAENHLEEAIQVLEQNGRDQSVTELRATASLLRLEKQSLSEKARLLRVQVEPWQVLPIALTTRHARGVE